MWNTRRIGRSFSMSSGRCAPRRQHLVEVADFLLEFLEEDFADFVVDLVARDLEATTARADRCGAQSGRCRGQRFDRLRRRDLRQGNVGLFDQRQRQSNFDATSSSPLDRHRRVRRPLDSGGRDGSFELRQRPVLQRLQAVARDVEDVVAIGTLLAQGFQVVLKARQRIGQRVQLAAVGHAMAPDQFALGIQPHAGQVVGR